MRKREMLEHLEEAKNLVRCVIEDMNKKSLAIPHLVGVESQLGEIVAILKGLKNVEFIDR